MSDRLQSEDLSAHMSSTTCYDSIFVTQHLYLARDEPTGMVGECIDKDQTIAEEEMYTLLPQQTTISKAA